MNKIDYKQEMFRLIEKDAKGEKLSFEEFQSLIEIVINKNPYMKHRNVDIKYLSMGGKEEGVTCAYYDYVDKVININSQRYISYNPASIESKEEPTLTLMEMISDCFHELRHHVQHEDVDELKKTSGEKVATQITDYLNSSYSAEEMDNTTATNYLTLFENYMSGDFSSTEYDDAKEMIMKHGLHCFYLTRLHERDARKAGIRSDLKFLRNIYKDELCNEDIKNWVLDAKEIVRGELHEEIKNIRINQIVSTMKKYDISKESLLEIHKITNSVLNEDIQTAKTLEEAVEAQQDIENWYQTAFKQLFTNKSYKDLNEYLFFMIPYLNEKVQVKNADNVLTNVLTEQISEQMKNAPEEEIKNYNSNILAKLDNETIFKRLIFNPDKESLEPWKNYSRYEDCLKQILSHEYQEEFRKLKNSKIIKTLLAYYNKGEEIKSNFDLDLDPKNDEDIELVKQILDCYKKYYNAPNVEGSNEEVILNIKRKNALNLTSREIGKIMQKFGLYEEFEQISKGKWSLSFMEKAKLKNQINTNSTQQNEEMQTL